MLTLINEYSPKDDQKDIPLEDAVGLPEEEEFYFHREEPIRSEKGAEDLCKKTKPYSYRQEPIPSCYELLTFIGVVVSALATAHFLKQ